MIHKKFYYCFSTFWKVLANRLTFQYKVEFEIVRKTLFLAFSST